VNGDEVRVVIVDDQAPFRDAAQAVVEVMDGFTVVGTAETGEDGLTLVRSLDPDLVLLDVNLPGISGVEVSRRLADEGSSAAVVLVSTYDVSECEDEVSRCGAAGYLRKSDFGADRLRELVRHLEGPVRLALEVDDDALVLTLAGACAGGLEGRARHLVDRVEALAGTITFAPGSEGGCTIRLPLVSAAALPAHELPQPVGAEV
jgi:CheY-like chemotaxis protein